VRRNVVASLVPLWRLLGAWCEDEQRSGRKARGTVALLVHLNDFSPQPLDQHVTDPIEKPVMASPTEQ